MNNLEILSERILDRYSKEKRRLVVVIGNSGVSKADQSVIDVADVVVRFNNYATRDGVQKTEDPFRCDILFSTFDLHSAGSRPRDVVIGIPYPFKAKEIYNKPFRWYNKANHWMVNPYLNMQCCMDLGLDSLGYAHPLPSIGFTALWHIRNWTAQFYICGFNWYQTGPGRFQNHDIRNTNYPTIWNHNYNLEVKWILANLYKKNNIMFSSECKKILDTAQYILQKPL